MGQNEVLQYLKNHVGVRFRLGEIKKIFGVSSVKYLRRLRRSRPAGFRFERKNGYNIYWVENW